LDWREHVTIDPDRGFNAAHNLATVAAGPDGDEKHLWRRVSDAESLRNCLRSKKPRCFSAGRSHVTAPHGGCILDSCAGEGEALITLAEKMELDPFGVELHEGRATTVQQAVDQMLDLRSDASKHRTRILQDSYLYLITSRSSYNFLYLNPLYDHDEEDGGDRLGRLEY
jgi:hypothetical protein